MAWAETFHCDVCNKEKREESEDWWLAWTETFSPAQGEADSEHEDEIDGDNRVINKMRVHSLLPVRAYLSHGTGKVNVRLRPDGRHESIDTNRLQPATGFIFINIVERMP